MADQIRIEAEAMTLSGDYGVRDFAGATGGKAITLPMGKSTTGKVGHATTTFSGESGLYEVELGYFKENDGGAKTFPGCSSCPIISGSGFAPMSCRRTTA